MVDNIPFAISGKGVSRQNPQNRSVRGLVIILKKIIHPVFAGVFSVFPGKIPLKLIIKYLRIKYGLITHFTFKGNCELRFKYGNYRVSFIA
ncbi:hypothetical protein DWV30_24385 [Bacteroides ovatus]|uniref:Uncharacterized protein n=1 Tax=Bacteroides ovatus TaxID=28116 RepID=A0A413EFK8_BACOV|nr:hypothetical protein DWZ47_27735 [Bacteroides sp. AF32-8BH]RGX05662.1 hypothetical protein DWV35_24665 [Bacteroides ovatus]RGX16754.1 hypothetical protein DWV30_24385 [Bacteroides ovatus]